MFSRILLTMALEEGEPGQKALDIAVTESRMHSAEMIVLSVIPSFNSPLVASFFPDDALEKAEKEAAVQLKRIVSQRVSKDVKVRPLVAIGSPSDLIVELAEKEKVDLIILPSHAKGLTQVILGSCASRVVERAACTVMVIKDYPKT